MNKKLVAIALLVAFSTASIAAIARDYDLTNVDGHKKKHAKIKPESGMVIEHQYAPEIEELIEGNKKFRRRFSGKHQELFEDLVQQGQKPKIMIISCSDSRVDPAMVFNRKPGLFFGARIIANLVPSYHTHGSYDGVAAALEYGIKVLKVKHVIIFGHTHCGGIKTLVEHGHDLKGIGLNSVAKWLEIGQPAYKLLMEKHGNEDLESRIAHTERYALINSLKNLTSFSWIKQLVDKGELSLHAWYIDLDSSGIYQYDQANDRWLFN